MESNGYNITADERRQIINSIPTVKVVDSCKENIQPRKSGRSVASLTTLFETNPNEREREIAISRKKFEEQLDTVDEQDDPLDIYVQHINWTHAMYPQGQSSEFNFVGLSSDVTNRFKSNPRYKSDPRYLKLWMRQGLALFYEEYSAYFERLKKVNEAVEVYERGIQLSAQPLKRLQKNLIHLKSRIHERQQRGLLKREQNEAKAQSNELRQHGRTMLGHKFDSRSRSSVSANVSSGIEAASASSSSLTRSRTFGNDRPSKSSSTSTQPTDEMSSFSVYVETTPTPPSSNIFHRSSTSQPITPHQKIENQHTIEKFSGAVLPQAEIVSEPIEPFQVYQDDTSTTTIAAPHQIRSLERSDSMLSISTGEESTVSKIRRNPTSDYPHKRHRTEQQSSEYGKYEKEMEKRFNKNRHIYMRSQSSKGGIEYITMSKSIRKEMSTEEYRVQMMKYPVVTSTEGDAIKSVSELFDEKDAYEEEEQDLTWTNPVQKFATTYRPPANENE
ncbi:unnamed protein product [Mucor hiemalis]